jgi:hypothetical protein
MAAEGVLAIPPKMIDPKNRNIVSYFSRFQVTVYRAGNPRKTNIGSQLGAVAKFGRHGS